MKITEAQKEIILKLQSGEWELAYSNVGMTHARIQKGGIGRGGESKKISTATFNVLVSKKIIEQNSEKEASGQWYNVYYKLTDAGKNIKID